MVAARLLIVSLVVLAHGLVLWLFWRVRAPVQANVETFASLLFFLPEPYPRAPHPSTPVHKGGSAGAGAVAVVADSALAEPARDSAITVSPPPPPGVDWLGELAGAADATLSREKKAQEQLGALLRKFRIEDDARNPHARPPGSFRWDEASIHRFDTRGSLPVWHLNERCVVVALIFAACAIGHIEVRGDLFQGAAAVHDERLATPRPNDAP